MVGGNNDSNTGSSHPLTASQPLSSSLSELQTLICACCVAPPAETASASSSQPQVHHAACCFGSASAAVAPGPLHRSVSSNMVLDTGSGFPSRSTRSHRHSIPSHRLNNYLRFLNELAANGSNTAQLFSTAVISGSSSAPNLKEMPQPGEVIEGGRRFLELFAV